MAQDIHLYRGTSIKQLAENFEGDLFENNSPIGNSAENSKYNLTPNLEFAIAHAEKLADNGFYLVLEFIVPEKIISGNPESLKMQIQENKDVIFAPDRNPDWDKDELANGYNCYFIRSKYLKVIHQFREDVSSIDEFKNKGRHFKIDGNQSKLKDYIEARNS